uniref:Uncharacterized protein n=1 Tax=Anopheles darlingi TaxID=43151 RepID=A0A2M4D9H5_ANODA
MVSPFCTITSGTMMHRMRPYSVIFFLGMIPLTFGAKVKPYCIPRCYVVMSCAFGFSSSKVPMYTQQAKKSSLLRYISLL